MSFFRRRMMMNSGPIIYNVTLNGTDVTSNISQVTAGQSATITLSGTTGKQVLPDSVKVSMGGVDITNTAYNLETGNIDISNATGNISIDSISAIIDSAYKPLAYINAPRRLNSNVLSTINYYPNSNTKLEMDVNITLVSGNSLLYSIKNPNTAPSASAPQFYFWSRISNSNAYSFAWGSKKQDMTSTTAGRIKTGERIKFTCDKGTFTYTNQAGSTRTQTLNGGTWAESTNYLRFFGYGTNDSNTNYAFYGTFYNAIISENDVVLRNYVPVKKISDGTCGIYDIINQFYRGNNNWIGPYLKINRTIENCSQSMLPSTYTTLVTPGGYDVKAVYGETWSCKFTPSTDYTFNDASAVFTIEINGVDKTSDVATYDSTTDEWTVSLVAHWNDTITITATAVSTS